MFANLVARAIRAFTWHRYRVYVDIQALQISLLGGRIFFKGIRYHGENETIFIQSGYVTWRYWLRSVQHADCTAASTDAASSNVEDSASSRDISGGRASQAERGGARDSRKLPCRIAIKVAGLEWFIYNRSPAYDAILSQQMTKCQATSTRSDQIPSSDSAAEKLRTSSAGSSSDMSAHTSTESSRSRKLRAQRDAGEQGSFHTLGKETTLQPDESANEAASFYLSLLPVRIECHKGAIVLGNEHTTSILTTTFDDARGQVDASSSGPLDLYKQVFDFDIERPVIQLKPNSDFKQPQLNAARKQQVETEPLVKKGLVGRMFRRRHAQRLSERLGHLFPRFRRSVESLQHGEQSDWRNHPYPNDVPGDGRWLGLSRYLDEDERDEHEGWDSVEYARYSTVADCPRVSLSFYWDVPGLTRAYAEKNAHDINGSPPPQWGLNLQVYGGSINYGPWSDRERANIQNTFFPNPFMNSSPAAQLSEGSPRQSTEFKLFIELMGETTLRIPTRESSKDWQWKGRADAVRGASRTKKGGIKMPERWRKREKNVSPDTRPFGWLSLTLQDKSTVSFNMDMVASDEGYRNKIDVDLVGSELTSSVNHGTLWKCGRQRVGCDLSNPLIWNARHIWQFDVQTDDMDLFLLRDHMFLLTDLVTDWAAGAQAEYYTFVPFEYKINLDLCRLKLFLNVNDSNIVNSPTDMEDNTFLSLRADQLTSSLLIPLLNFNPDQNTIHFEAQARRGGLDFLAPLRNTQNAFIENPFVADLGELDLKGSYRYWQSTSTALTDVLLLDLSGTSLDLTLYGFLIGYFLKIKDNYFGEYQHFRTSEEFHEELAAPSHDSSPLGRGVNPHKKTNDLDVILHVRVDNASALLPSRLYSSDDGIKLDILAIQADLRFTNYYMDLGATFSPIEAASFSRLSAADGDERERDSSGTQLYIDGLSIFGHRLFGLPPVEPTYVCNWDFDIGKIVGECEISFVGLFFSALQCFTFCIDDEENALTSPSTNTIHDVTFLRAKLGGVSIWVIVEDQGILLKTDAIQVQFDDLAQQSASDRLRLDVPGIILAAVDAQDVMRGAEKSVTTSAHFVTSIQVRMAEQKVNSSRNMAQQQQHIRHHDQRTFRTPWLLHATDTTHAGSRGQTRQKIQPPAMPFPGMPEPVITSDLDGDQLSFMMDRKSRLRRQSSFLSYPQPDFSHLRERQWGSNSSRIAELAHETDQSSQNYVGISSSWRAPHFPFQLVQPDAKDVPQKRTSFSGSGVADGISYQDLQSLDESTSQVRLLLDFREEIRGFCSPKFICAVGCALKYFQPNDPSSLLDSLQLDVIREILSASKPKAAFGKTTDMIASIPALRFRLLNETSGSRRHDQYDVEMEQATLSLRNSKLAEGDLTATVNSHVVAHFRSDSISFSGLSYPERNFAPDIVFRLRLGDIAFWLSSSQRINSQLQIKSINIASSGPSIEELPLLVLRTSDMVKDLGQAFDRFSGPSQPRSQILFSELMEYSAKVQDPPFLTRSAYLLRVEDKHLRTNASWKIISRLRYIYQSLPCSNQETVSASVFGDNVPSCRPRDTVLANDDAWRSWDLENAAESRLIVSIWGSDKIDSDKNSVSKEMAVSVDVARTRLVLDPGPKQNEISIDECSLRVSLNGIRQESPDSRLKSQGSQNLRVQSSCLAFSIALDWELIDLTQSMLILFKKSNSAADSATLTTQKEPLDRTSPIDVHFAFLVHHGIVTLDSINLRTVLISKELRGSVVHQSSDTLNTNAVVSASKASWEILHQSRLLSMSRVFLPSILASRHVIKSAMPPKHQWKLAAACNQMLFDVKDDFQSLVYVASCFVDDEISYINRIVEDLQRLTESSKPGPAPTDSTNSVQHEFTVALFLDKYRLSLAVLPSLAYVVSGHVARTAIIPIGLKKFHLNLDLKSHAHAFESKSKNIVDKILFLDMPPINGRVEIDISDCQPIIGVELAFEVIKLDASAVRNLLGTVNRPEITRMLQDVTKDISSLMEKIDSVGSRPESAEVSKDSRNTSSALLFAGNLSVAGLSIHTEASGPSSKYVAALDLNFGTVQVRLANYRSSERTALAFPDFNIQLRKIAFNISRRTNHETRSFGDLSLDLKIQGTSKVTESDELSRFLHITSSGLELNLFPETAALAVDIAIHLQERIKKLDLSHEVMQLKRLQRLTRPDAGKVPIANGSSPSFLFGIVCTVEISTIMATWHVLGQNRNSEDLVFSIQKVDLSMKKENAARLGLQNLQLQMVPKAFPNTERSSNSALLPEVIFNVAYISNQDNIGLVFQAAGKALDLRLTSDFMIPVSVLRQSIGTASQVLRSANAAWASGTVEEPSKVAPKTNLFGAKRLASLLVDADFAGAVVSLQGRKAGPNPSLGPPKTQQNQLGGKYGQFAQSEPHNSATLRAPAVALKVEYSGLGQDGPNLNAEMKIDASSNILYPGVVPLVMEVSDSVKQVVGETSSTPQDQQQSPEHAPHGLEKTLVSSDPSTILGGCKLNIGLWICRQEFTLSCKPVAHVDATARFEDVYLTINSVQSAEQSRFFALLLTFRRLQILVKHVYSSEPTASFDVESVIMSLMNSKHVSNASGLSAVIKIAPMKALINARQLQDLLLFREIWVPVGAVPDTRSAAPTQGQQAYIVQRYQQVAAAGAFPWNSTLAIEKLNLNIDLGHSLGKSSFTLSNLWLSSRKNSDWEQNLCAGFGQIMINCIGRMGGVVLLDNFRVRTSIKWPMAEHSIDETPLIQASLGFEKLQVNAAFDYQHFLVADISSFDFLMYNVRQGDAGDKDRLVAILDGDKVQVFCTSSTGSQCLAIYQAMQRLVQEKKAAYQSSVKGIEQYLHRANPSASQLHAQVAAPTTTAAADTVPKAVLGLHTDVVVTLAAINIGAFPNTFFDNQIFKLEALNAQARFAVTSEDLVLHSGLGITLGQLRVALSNVNRAHMQRGGALQVDDVVQSATGSRGGTILKVPKVVASMQTWQSPSSNVIDYIFKSAFEGKVDVGWNYSRISFIRNMWHSHSRALAARLGKPLPESAVQIKGVTQPSEGVSEEERERNKITAVVNVPQSRYEYKALQAPIIETPQLRDMGEATPPLEWIGLNRDKLPHVTHQIIIVTLLEVAKEVEDAYSKILGAS